VSTADKLPVDTNQAGVYSRNGTIAAVRDGFSTLRLIGGEHVIEGSIFSDDHDDMLDGAWLYWNAWGFLERRM
jgi:hypothetical protein